MAKPTTHVPKGLMAKLARALKVDLIFLQDSGKLSPDAVRRMQNHCGACGDRNLCNRLLDANSDKMAAPPAFCPNKNVFNALRKERRKR